MTGREVEKQFETMAKKIYQLQQQVELLMSVVSERKQADIDYIAMEAGIDLDLGKDEEIEPE